MGYVNGEEIQTGYVFGNGEIIHLPPQRNLYYVSGDSLHHGKPFHLELICVTMDEIRESFKHRRTDLPDIVGNWDLMNIWIDNMWEALYNPVKLLRHRERRWAIMDGCHRLRLLDAMDINQVWVYEFIYDYAPGDWRISVTSVPSKIVTFMRQNNRPPRVGTIKGTCVHCGTLTGWTRSGAYGGNRIEQYIQICKACGKENDYPYPGRL